MKLSVITHCLVAVLCFWVTEVSAAEPVAKTTAQDRFGVTMLHPTISHGREWFADWEDERHIHPYSADPLDNAFFNEDGEIRVLEGVASATAGLTRLVVLTPKNPLGEYTASLWTNVEMTAYVIRGTTARTLDYQAFYLSARSGEKHNDSQPCDGTSYHATLRFDGKCGFKKELWHTGGYTPLRPEPTPRPWATVPEGKWIGMKFVCRNVDHGQHVRLELYLDVEEKNEWKRIAEYKDTGDWKGEKPGCDRPQNGIITEGRPAVYFRTDWVNVEIKKFSVREIAPLP